MLFCTFNETLTLTIVIGAQKGMVRVVYTRTQKFAQN